MPHITVSPLKLSDWAWARQAMPGTFPEIDPAYVSHLLRNLQPFILIARDERGQRLGFCQVQYLADPRRPDCPQAPGPSLWVNFIGVDPAQRKSGAGRALLDHCHQWAARLGCTQVELDVLTSNATAIAVYERLGYQRRHTLVDTLNRQKYNYALAITPQQPASERTPQLPGAVSRVVRKLLYRVLVGR